MKRRYGTDVEIYDWCCRRAPLGPISGRIEKYDKFDSHLRMLTSPPMSRGYAIPLRLIVGFGFMEHGYAKIARRPEKYASILHALGVPASDLLAWVAILVELFGGLAVFLGAFIPLASIPMAIVLLVAILTVHVPKGFSSIKLLSVDAVGAYFGQPGFETALLYLAALVALVLGGSGPLALDRFLLHPRRHQ